MSFPSDSTADTMIVFGTSLSFVRVGWPGRLPFHSSVLAFGARIISFVHLSDQSEYKSKLDTVSVAVFSASWLFVPQISMTVSMEKSAAVTSLAKVLCSLRVIPTVYGLNSRAIVK